MPYLLLQSASGATAVMQNIRTLFPGANVSLTDGGPGGNYTITVFGDRTAWMGGISNLRALPTSGTLTGDYYNSGNWTQTGAITSNYVRVYNSGTMTFNNTWTVNTECAGGLAGTSSISGIAPGGTGAGLGGGQSLISYNTTTGFAGGGGGFGGGGGKGASSTSGISPPNGGSSYLVSQSLSGSGGAGAYGSTGITSSAGGAGGGSLYIESTGTIVFSSGTALTANGGAASAANTNGGGGSGGGIQVRCLSTVTINSGASITATGGSGGSGSTVGGGGGGGGYIEISGTTVTNSGTVSAGGGSAGTGGAVAATAGSTGQVVLNSYPQGPRSAG